MVTLLVIIAGLSLAYGLRTIIFQIPSSDEPVALWMVERQRRRRWITYDHPDSVVKGLDTYPNLYHFLISRFAPRRWQTVSKIINISSDILIAFVVGIIALIYAPQVGITDIPPHSALLAAACSAILYVTSPILLAPSKARMRGLSARSFGGLFVTGYGIGMGLAMIGQPLLGGAIAILFFWLTVITSLFGLQAVVFFSLCVAVIELSWIPLAILTLSFALCLALPVLRASGPLLNYHIDHKIWYFHNAAKATSAAERNRVSDFVRLPYYLFFDHKKLWRAVTRQLTPIIGLYSAPSVVVCCWLYLVGDPTYMAMMNISALRLLNDWILASLIVFALTSLPWFTFLGQAERYFEYSASASAILFSYWLFTDTMQPAVIAMAVTILQASVILVLFDYDVRFGKRSIFGAGIGEESLRNAAKAVAELDVTLRIATIPFKACYSASLLFRKVCIKAKYFYALVSQRGVYGYPYMSPPKEHEEKQPHFEVPPYTPSELRQKFGIDLILIDKDYLRFLRVLWGDEFHQDWPKIFDDDRILVIDIRGRRDTTPHMRHATHAA